MAQANDREGPGMEAMKNLDTTDLEEAIAEFRSAQSDLSPIGAASQILSRLIEAGERELKRRGEER